MTQVDKHLWRGRCPLENPAQKTYLKLPNETRKVENYNYMLMKNPIDVKIINKRLVKLLDVPQPY